MAEHVDRPQQGGHSQQDEDVTRAVPPASHTPPPSGGDGAKEEAKEEEAKRRKHRQDSIDWAKAKEQVVGLLAGIARWLGLIFAVILVLHVIFVIGEANPQNGIATFVRNWSDVLVIGFDDLFTPDDTKLRVLVNFGIAALFWLVVSALASRIIRRVGDSITVGDNR